MSLTLGYRILIRMTERFFSGVLHPHLLGAAGRVAGTQPQLGHPPHLGDHRQERMQTRFDPLLGVAAGHALLLAVLVQESGRIQIQRVALLAAGQPVQAPVPERTKATQVGPRRIEPLKETPEHRLTGHAGDAQDFGHERIAPQIGDVGQLARVTEQTVQEGQRLLDGQERRLWDVGQGWGSAAVSCATQRDGRSQPQKVALPACGESCWLVKPMAIDWPPALNLNSGATVW